MILYHGSAVETFVPTFGLGKEKHDYGKGFYLTESLELAREWSVARSKMYGLIENDPRNRLEKTFKDIV